MVDNRWPARERVSFPRKVFSAEFFLQIDWKVPRPPGAWWRVVHKRPILRQSIGRIGLGSQGFKINWSTFP